MNEEAMSALETMPVTERETKRATREQNPMRMRKRCVVCAELISRSLRRQLNEEHFSAKSHTIRKRTARIGCPQTWEFRGFWPVKLKSQILGHCRRPRPLPQSPSVRPARYVYCWSKNRAEQNEEEEEGGTRPFPPSFLFRAGATT